MLNRRATTSRSEEDPNSNGAIHSGTTTPKGRKRKKSKTKKRSTWRAWIPLCFVVFYVIVVILSLWMLAKMFLIPSSAVPGNNGNSNANDNFIQESKNNKIIRHRHSNQNMDLPYPKIIRDSKNYPQLSQDALDMCTRTLWHTIETTTIVLPNKETFIHTGDIDDLWLRDSAAQIHPLLVPLFGPNRTQSLIQLDAKLDRIVAGLIRRTALYIRHDPYANAFRIDDSYVFSAAQKKLGRHDLISTWNYELDSACYWIRMVFFYWKQSNNANNAQADSVVALQRVQEAAEIMVDVWIAEQKHENDDESVPRGPLFDCVNCNKPYRYPGLQRNGKGTPTNASSGLTWTGFRPSDDECTFGFLVPANMFAVVALEYAEELANAVWNNPILAAKAQQLAKEIQTGIETHAVVDHPTHGKIYAYEVDGLGNSLLMDDANVPSLLSIPYLGYKHYDPEIYANTRRFVFSKDNPTYQKGTNAMTGEVEGYGSPHMQAAIRQNIWPMSLAIQGLTR